MQKQLAYLVPRAILHGKSSVKDRAEGTRERQGTRERGTKGTRNQGNEIGDTAPAPTLVEFWAMKAFRSLSVCVFVAFVSVSLFGQSPAGETPAVPDWAQPGSATHKQVPPPVDFHRPSRNFDKPIGIFDGESDVGGAVVPGSAAFDAATNQYTIHSAGYNIWYTRDEFRYLWKKMSGDVSLAADATFPDPKGYDDRKVVLIIRQNL